MKVWIPNKGRAGGHYEEWDDASMKLAPSAGAEDALDRAIRIGLKSTKALLGPKARKGPAHKPL